MSISHKSHRLSILAAACVAVLSTTEAHAQAARNPATVVEGSRITASGSVSSISAVATPGSGMAAGASVPGIVSGRFERTRSAGNTSVDAGSVNVQNATVRNTEINASGTASQVTVTNGQVRAGAVNIGNPQ